MTVPPARFDLCALGNVCIDMNVTVPFDFLERHAILKSRAVVISYDQLLAICRDLPNPSLTSGGAGANVAHVFQSLGGRACFQGMTGADSMRDLFLEDMQRHNITAHLPISPDPERLTNQVVCMITPDGDRSFASYDGSERPMTGDYLDLDMIKSSRIVYFDGYMLMAWQAQSIYDIAYETIKSVNGLMCFNPVDLQIIEDFHDLVQNFVKRTDILIGNTAEMMAIFGTQPLDKLAQMLANRYLAGAMTNGTEGAYIYNNSKVHFVPSPVTDHLETIDTNGAGDHFAAAFLYGLNRGMSLEETGLLAQKTALDCLTHTGARPLQSLKHLVSAA